LNKIMNGSHLIPVGKVVRTHGIRGALKVYPYGESLAAQKAGEKLFLRSAPDGEPAAFTIASLRPQGKFLLMELRELADMDAALKLAGWEILLTEDRLPPTSEGEYYHYQLIGLGVETRDGKKVGTLRGIIEAGANDVYVVEGEDGKEILIPAVEEIVREIDLDRRLMVVDPPEGLIE